MAPGNGIPVKAMGNADVEEGNMTTGLNMTVIAVIALFLASAPAHAADEKAAHQEIIQFYAALERTVNSDAFFKDPSIAFPFFDMEKFRLFDVMAPEEYTGAALRAHFLNISVNVPGILDFINMDITTDGELAFVSYIMLGVGQQKDGPVYHLRSRASDGLVKTDGKWRIVHEHLSMAIPRDKFAEVLLSRPAPEAAPANSSLVDEPTVN